jgi:hypothetical protein
MKRALSIGHNWPGEPSGAAERRCRCEGHRLAAAAASTDTARSAASTRCPRPRLAYEKQREGAAKQLGVRVSVLDELVEAGAR